MTSEAQTKEGAISEKKVVWQPTKIKLFWVGYSDILTTIKYI